MANSVFQNVMQQLKDVTDRYFGVIDGEGCVISCTEIFSLYGITPQAISAALCSAQGS